MTNVLEALLKRGPGVGAADTDGAYAGRLAARNRIKSQRALSRCSWP